MTRNEHYREAERLAATGSSVEEALVNAVRALTHAVLSLREAPPPAGPKVVDRRKVRDTLRGNTAPDLHTLTDPKPRKGRAHIDNTPTPVQPAEEDEYHGHRSDRDR